MRLLLFLLICVPFFSFSYGQDTKNNNNLIYIDGFSWKQGDKKLSSSNLKKEVFKTPLAIPYFKKGKINSGLSEIFFVGGLLFTLASINVANSYYCDNGHKRFSYDVAATSFFIASGLTLKFSLKNKGMAVHLRNLDLLKQ